MFKNYYQLTKPGIIFGNDITAIAGFFLASKGQINLELLFTTILGISFIIASACVFNNYMDRGIDRKMDRTKNRALVTKTISPMAAIIYATVLGILGFTILGVFTNITTFLVGIVGFFVYEILYGKWKRLSIWSTAIGSIAGAVPPVAGYTAVTGKIDMAAVLLFVILAFWQMPHFYAIAIYRLNDYKSAGIPVLPVVKGIFVTKVQILIFTLGLAISVILLSLFGFTGKVYLFVMLMLSLIWIIYAVTGFSTKNTNLWARRMFMASLIFNLAFSILIATNFLIT